MTDYAKYIRWLFALLLAWFAWFSYDAGSPNFSRLGVAIYLAPMALLIVRWKLGAYIATVFAIFIALQAAAPSLSRSTAYLNQPFVHKELVYEPGAVPGMLGRHVLTSDDHGFRTSRKIDYSHPAAGLRIFAIGGSTTHQFDTDDRKTWPSLLQEELKNLTGADVEVVNAGFSGTRAEQHLAAFKTSFRYYPDAAVFLVGVNDWRRHMLNALLGISAAPAYPWENFSLKNSLLGQVYQAYQNKRQNDASKPGEERPDTQVYKKSTASAAEKKVDCDKGRTVTLPTNFPESVSESFSSSLKAIADLCKAKGLPCMVMTQPHGYKPSTPAEFQQRLSCSNRWGPPYTPTPDGQAIVFRDNSHMGRIAEFYNEYTRRFATENGLMLCDLDRKIEPTPEMLYDEVHYTEAGSRKVAAETGKCLEALVKQLKEKKNAGNAH